tara:strand:+ start:2610 stop:3902 length:1293 start_codon:yes stop_codon:yes gene_type:complete
MINKYYSLAKKKLFKLNRSLTGKGNIKTLKHIKEEFPGLKIKYFNSSKKVFDWTIPKEWNVKKAYVSNKFDKKIIDFEKNNLHLVGYSTPFFGKLKKNNLLKHIYTYEKLPDAIPYVTSYYKKKWGFCISQNQKNMIKKNYKSNDFFKIVLDSTFKKNGKMHYGEFIIKGKTREEILISTYICHPSMANNELSGIIVSMALLNYFKNKKLNRTLRFVFIPETIGAISYINKNFKTLKKNIIGGYNLSCIGDERSHSCMLSKYANSPSDESLILSYKKLRIKKFKIYSFLERGSNERQFNSPYIDLGITSIFRTMYGKFPEYHTSKDNFKLVTLKGVKGGFMVAKEAINILDKTIIPKSKIICEPNLGKRGLYPTLSTIQNKRYFKSRNILNFLQYADGKNTINMISNLIKLKLSETNKLYRILKLKNILE